MRPHRPAALIAGLVAIGMLTSGAGLAQSVQPQATPGQAAPAPGAAAQVAAAPGSGKHIHTETERKGRMNQDIFLGVYLSLDKECKVGATPRIEFVTNPVGGKMKTRNNAINLRDVPGAPRRNCVGISPNGLAVIYRSEKRFKGEDKVVFKAIYPNGDVREVTAKVLVQ